jgi:hypothetical protein
MTNKNKGPTKKKPTEEKRGKGQPRSFPTDKDFKDKFIEYIQYCNKKERFPNIAGFCAFTDITRDTYYAQQEYYSDTYNKTRQILEDEVWQDNSYRSQLYLKSVFGHKDKQVIESTNVNMNTDMTVEEAEQYLKELGIKL